MNFTLKLSLSEVVKNKFKFLIAIVVTLILFMSAFALCNISTAIPHNFFNYYESYMNDSIGVYIYDADRELFDNSEQFFVKFEPFYNEACSDFTLSYEGRVQPSYKEEMDEEGITHVTFFASVLVDEENADNYAPDIYEQFFAEEVGGSGSVWELSQEGIWISDVVAQNIGVAVGDIMQYNYGGASIDLEVKGIYSDKALMEYLKEQYANDYIVDRICHVTVPSCQKILFDSNSTFGAYGVIGKIDKLYDTYFTLSQSYAVEEGVIFDMIKEVKNAQIICMIVGVIMIICGIVIMLNFISMVISQNIKHISLLRVLGTSTFRIMMAYTLIFMAMISIVCLISWMTLPLYNYIISLYCSSMGYTFSLGINYWVVAGVFALCYLVTGIIMSIKWKVMQNTPPNVYLLEED